MLPLRTAALMTLATTALAGSVLSSLPDCWDQCSDTVSGSSCGWYDVSCICDLSNDSDYLATTILCAKTNCGTDWFIGDVDRFLSPIELTCSLTLSGISQLKIDDAQNAASAEVPSPSQTDTDTETPQPTEQKTTEKPSKASHTPKPKTRHSEAEQTTLKATIVESSTTAIVQQPFVFGTNGGVSSGERSTSIVVQTVNIVPVPVSTASSTKSGGKATPTPTKSSAQQTVESTASATATSKASSGAASSSGAPTSDSGSAGGGGTLFDGAGVMVAPMSMPTLALMAAAIAWLL